MKRGFTLIELMVAAVLLAMLMTILTMIFNQSSVSWSTGVAAVVSIGDTRSQMSDDAYYADNLLATEGAIAGVRTASIWDRSGGGSVLRTNGRALETGTPTSGFPAMRDRLGSETLSFGGGQAAGGDTYVVGVASNGPDGIAETWDDISTFPEDQL